MPLFAARFLFCARYHAAHGSSRHATGSTDLRHPPQGRSYSSCTSPIAAQNSSAYSPCQHERDHARTPGRDVLALPCGECRKRQQDQPDGNQILRLRERAVRALRQPRQRE